MFRTFTKGDREMKKDSTINWKKITSAIKQKQKVVKDPGDLSETINTLKSLITKCGEQSKNTKMCSRIGRVIIANKKCRVIAPCCPDYGHENGCYNFKGLGGNTSLLAEKHIAFLKLIKDDFPNTDIILLFADQEAENPELCLAVKKTKEEFQKLVNQSIEKTRLAVESLGWQVEPMTKFFPDLTKKEKEMENWIKSKPEFRYRIMLETISRTDMYQKIALAANKTISSEEMRERTVITAAQYVAFGQFASEQQFIICNHTTVNLSWYLQTNAAIIHNPISVY